MTADIAAGRLHLGMQRFLAAYPMLGGVVAAWTVTPGSTTTMAIGFSGLEFRLYYDPEFVTSITLDELMGVLHHEARHIVFGHVFMKEADFPDADALLIATEVTVNEGIPEPLPGEPITLALFSKLPPDETTVERYRRLASASHPTNKPRSSNGSGAGGKSSGSSEGDGAHGCVTSNNPRTDMRSPRRSPGNPVDDHGHWGEISQHHAIAELALQTVLGQVLKSLTTVSSYERSCLLQGPGRGLDPGNELTVLSGTGVAPTISWQQVLRTYVGRVRQSDFTYMRAPRRMSHLLGIVPGTRRRARRPRLQVVIDTSGSIKDQHLEDIAAELTVLSRANEVIVVECDTRIQRVYRFVGRIDHVCGRGGTSFIPPLERVFLQKTQANLVVFFTDLDGGFPERPPQVPVIWVVVKGRSRTAPWGRVIPMDRKPV